MNSVPTPILAAALFTVSLVCTVFLIAFGAAVPDELKGLLTLFAGAVVGSVAPSSVTLKR